MGEGVDRRMIEVQHPRRRAILLLRFKHRKPLHRVLL